MKISEISVLALSHFAKGNFQEAENLYQEILKIEPDNFNALHFLGLVYYRLKQYDLAIKYLNKVLLLQPDYFDVYNNLGIVLQERGQIDEAIIYYQKAIEIDPNSFLTYYNIGNLFKEKKQFRKAMDCYQKALQINPNLIEAYHQLGNVFTDIEQSELAINCYKKALQLNPSSVEILYSVAGNLLDMQGKFDESEMYFRKVLKINPSFYFANHSLLFNMCHNPKYNAQTIYNEHKKFAEQYEKPLSYLFYHNDRTPDRKIRVGYVSPDFRRHSVAYFIEPVLREHNKEHIEVYCYSNKDIEDEVTGRLKEYADHWRNIAKMSDKEAIELIQNDRIDILVDLAGHSADNRLLLFARKPVPVQVSWIGYPATTGMSVIDYRIVDKYTDLPGMSEQYNSETLIRLPHCFLCYLPYEESPEIVEAPVFKNGYITFGSFNKISKISPAMVSLWGRILKAIPNAILVLKNKGFSDKTVRQSIMDIFAEKDISYERIKLQQWEASIKEHLSIYNRIDIGLDTFPYNGTTTTCEALWMGVPVVTLAGDNHASRVGISLLSNVGLTELIARTYDEYLELAVNLAADIEKLRNLRAGLRDKMAHSPLTDAKTFTVDLEKCYRTMWESWCKSA
jgi:protein O-GlcNAc transferase